MLCMIAETALQRSGLTGWSAPGSEEESMRMAVCGIPLLIFIVLMINQAVLSILIRNK